MNDAADKPSKPTSGEPEFREISDEELQLILEKHKQWLAAKDKTGLDHLRANLSGGDLRNANFSMAELQWAALDFARLQGGHLIAARLQGASLVEAQLQGASLVEAQLQGADLEGAQLQGASFYKAHLDGAFLTFTNFERLAFTDEGNPAQERSTDLTDADFRDADLSNAQLATVTGLRAEMLAGAVLTNAKLPEDIKTFDQLKHVEETSRNAITVFFGLLAASLYSWLTIATTTDVALITGTASSPLPIINTNIALSGFYVAAPLILIAVYCYFHLYLQRLWRCLASLPAIFPDDQALDDKAYPWLLNGLVRKHFKKLELDQRPLTRVENFVSILLAWWVVPFTLLAFWLRFLSRHDWPVTALHVLLIALAAWFGVYSYRLAVRTLSGGAPATEEENERGRPARIRGWAARSRLAGIWRNLHMADGMMKATGAMVAIILVLSVQAANDPGENLLTNLGYETYADLMDDDVSTKPSGWTGREETADIEIGQVKGADLKGRDLRAAYARLAFLVKAKLSGADLRGADLWSADLRYASLGGADLRGANLLSADLRGAYLPSADLRGAGFWQADLRGADLRVADLRGALHLTQAQLDGACGNDNTQLPQGLTVRTCPVTVPPGSLSPLSRLSAGPQPR